MSCRSTSYERHDDSGHGKRPTRNDGAIDIWSWRDPDVDKMMMELFQCACMCPPCTTSRSALKLEMVHHSAPLHSHTDIHAEDSNCSHPSNKQPWQSPQYRRKVNLELRGSIQEAAFCLATSCQLQATRQVLQGACQHADRQRAWGLQ